MVSLPFKKYPPRLIAEMAYNVVFWLNSFLHNDGIHPTISPRTLITGLAIDYHKHCKIGFGTYIQVHEEGDNSLRQRTSGAIALQPPGNDQGGHYFLSLQTGKRINRYTWTELPMPNMVISQVNRLAIAAEKNDGIVITDMDSNILSEQFMEEVNNDITTNNTGIGNTETSNNQLPSEAGAIEEHADHQLEATEAIEDEKVSTIDDKMKQMRWMRGHRISTILMKTLMMT